MLLKNSQISLRALEPEDLELLYSWENDSELWTYGSTLSPYSKLALRQYINDSLEQDIFQSRQLRLMIDLDTGKTIGTIDLYDIDIHNGRAGIGILIDKSHREKKFASLTLELVKEYAFDFLHIHQLYAYISVNNTQSINLFKKCGYKESGHLRDWIKRNNGFEDIQVFQLIKKNGTDE